MTAPLETRQLAATPDDLALLKACFDANEDQPRDARSLAWQYLDPPAQRVLVEVALDRAAGKTAGVYAVFPVWFSVGERRVLGTQSLDTLVDAGYRGRSLFTKLARLVYERCMASGVSLVYGFPNQNSASGFFGKLEWTSLDPVPFLIRPLRTGYFLRRAGRAGRLLARIADVSIPSLARSAPPGIRAEEVTRFDDRFDALWRSFAGSTTVGVERGSEYLNWRFGDKPGANYTRLAAYRGETLAGFVTYCVLDKHGGRIAYIMELLFDPREEACGEWLLNTAVRESARAGADAVLAWNLDHSPNARAFRRNTFLPLPERLRPIELHFGARAFDPTLGALITDRTKWYLSYCDSDTV